MIIAVRELPGSYLEVFVGAHGEDRTARRERLARLVDEVAEGDHADRTMRIVEDRHRAHPEAQDLLPRERGAIPFADVEELRVHHVADRSLHGSSSAS